MARTWPSPLMMTTKATVTTDRPVFSSLFHGPHSIPVPDSSFSLGVVRFLAQSHAPRGRESGDRRRGTVTQLRQRVPCPGVVNVCAAWRGVVGSPISEWYKSRKPPNRRYHSQHHQLTRSSKLLINRATMAFKVFRPFLDRCLSYHSSATASTT